jgi:hypothetical protein
MPTILILTKSDQSTSPLAKHKGIDICATYDREANLVAPFRNIFDKVVVFDVLSCYIENGPTSTTKKLKALILQEMPDYMIWISSSFEIEPEVLAFAQTSGVKTISWFFDDEMIFYNYSVMWIPVSDFVLTASPAYVKKYQEYGVPAYLTFMSPNEEIFQNKKIERDIDVLFIGNNIADRQEFIDYVKQHNIEVTIFGRGWDTGYLKESSDLFSYYNRSKINLCFTKGMIPSVKQYKGKIFEICMCGGFLLVEYVDGMESYFEDTVDVIFFKDKYELLLQIQKYLPLPAVREKIAENGYRKVTEKYRMSVQFSKIFEDIFHFDDKDYKNICPHKINDTRLPILNLKKAKTDAAQYHFWFAIAHLKEKNFTLFVDEYIHVLKNYILSGFSLPAFFIYRKIKHVFR